MRRVTGVTSGPTAPGGAPRLQRVLATMAAAVFAVSALSIGVLFITRAAGTPPSAYRGGLLQVLAVLPTPGLAITLALVLTLVVLNIVRRGRSQER